MSAPDKLYVTPYYKNPEQHDLDVRQLRQDAHKAYDLAYQGDYPGAQLILLDWALHCSEAVNDEAKFSLVWMGHLFLEAFLLMPQDTWNSTVFVLWADNVYWNALDCCYYDYNNHGSWGILGAVLLDFVTCRDPLRHKDRITHHINQTWDTKGVMVHETKRTNSGIWYSYFSLAPLFRLSQLLGCINKYQFIPPLEWLWKYSVEPALWPYRLPRNFLMRWIWRKLYPCSDELVLPRRHDWPANLFLEAGKSLWRQDWLYYASKPLNEGIHIFRGHLYEKNG